MSILIFLIILSALVIVHEAGHLLAAKYFGIRVDEFGIGFPPKVKKLFRWRGTDFILNSLPFGGYVKIYGENFEDADKFSTDSFGSKNRAIQAAVLAAGVFFNLVFGFILLTLAFRSPVEGFENFGLFTVETVIALWQLISGAIQGQADLSSVVGPVGLVGLVGEVSAMGFRYLLLFTSIISINLAILNLLPLPALDGGRLLFTLIEAVMRKPIPPRVFNTLNTAGFALLILLMIFITARDVGNLF
ncbi:MAG TPA: site-2 protease family protein [Candidatus Paceibacterota bacterium]